MDNVLDITKNVLQGLSEDYSYIIEWIPEVVCIKKLEALVCIIPFKLISAMKKEYSRNDVIRLIILAVKNMKEPGTLTSISEQKKIKGNWQVKQVK